MRWEKRFATESARHGDFDFIGRWLSEWVYLLGKHTYIMWVGVVSFSALGIHPAQVDGCP